MQSQNCLLTTLLPSTNVFLNASHVLGTWGWLRNLRSHQPPPWKGWGFRWRQMHTGRAVRPYARQCSVKPWMHLTEPSSSTAAGEEGRGHVKPAVTRESALRKALTPALCNAQEEFKPAWPPHLQQLPSSDLPHPGFCQHDRQFRNVPAVSRVEL